MRARARMSEGQGAVPKIEQNQARPTSCVLSLNQNAKISSIILQWQVQVNSK